MSASHGIKAPGTMFVGRSLAMGITRISVIAVVALLLYGCVVGPDYKRPDLKMPDKWNAPLADGEKPGEPQIVEWWKGFGDATLDGLVTRALESNFDLRTAASRIREARANLQITEADLWPQLGSSMSYTRSQSRKAASGSDSTSLNLSPQGFSITNRPASGNPTVTVNSDYAGTNPSAAVSFSQTGAAPNRQSDLFQAGFDARWELDLFGGVQRAQEAAKAEIQVAEESRNSVRVSLVSEVARNYFELREAQNHLDIAKNNIRIQKDALEIVKSRFQAGLTSELDVKTAEAQLATTTSSVPGLEVSIQTIIHRLSGLLGQEPGSLQAELSPVAPLPATPPEIPVGLPTDLLRRRPDVRLAERELAASTARIGVATADLFPKFSLTGSFSGQTDKFDRLLRGANNIWSIGPGISWPVFDAGRIRANIAVQNARQEQAMIAYEKSVIQSLEDVENALVAYAKEQNRLVSLSEAVEANRKALDIAKSLYGQGLVNFLNVLDAERSLFAAEGQEIMSKGAILTNLVAIYKALGGGWDAPTS